MNKIYKLSLLIVVLLFAAGSAHSQRALETFGKNRLQYDEFDWRYLDSENFDVYFYSGGEDIAREVTIYLESEFERITDLIGYPPYAKTRVFLYNSVDDLQQSNVGLNNNGLSPGGETKFVKSNIEVAHPGSMSELKEELLYKVSEAIVNEMMYGGNLKDMFQSAVLLNLPEWFIEGAALYASKGWSIEMDDYVRELLKTRKPKKLNRLSGKEARLAGQSVWNFIAERYGKSAIANILNYTRIIRNEEKSVTITLGISFDQLMQEWLMFYTNISNQVDQYYIPPPESAQLTNNKNERLLGSVALSPDGESLAYTVNNAGKFEVIVRNVTSGKENTVLSGGYKVLDQPYETTLPLLDWADTTRLGIIHSKRGRMTFTIYDVLSHSKLPRYLDRFSHVRDFSFSSNGRLLAVSAVVDGQNDLFLLSTLRDRTKRLTNDIYDDISPVFLPNSNTIVFSSNRKSDTLQLAADLTDVTNNYNLFAYSLDTTENVLGRITNTVSRDYHPVPVSGSQIMYMSDQKGIINLFNYNITTGIYSQITNFTSSIESFDYNNETNALAFILRHGGEDEVFYIDSFNPDQQTFTPQTSRQQIKQARELQEKRQQQVNQGLTIEEIVRRKMSQREDQAEMDTVRREQQENEGNEEGEEDIINTDDYEFDEEVVAQEKTQPSTADTFLEQYRKSRGKRDISGPFPYQTRFSAETLVTSFVIDPLRGFGVLLQTEMSDMLENHKFSGGVMITTDLRSGDIFGEYNFLKYLLDFSAGFERNVIQWDRGANLHKYSKNTLNFGVSYPFSPRARLSLKPFYMFTRFDDLEAIPSAPPEFQSSVIDHYAGGTAEFIFDNSNVNGMNLIEGTRAKVSFTHNAGVSNGNLSFSNLTVDFRHYQKIYKYIVFAGRIYYGSFFGNRPKQYLLGGMDNWMFNEENTTGSNNPLDPRIERNNSDLLFVEYATNLRGFDYATLVGQNTLLFNAELRIPLIRTIQNGPIASNFFKNLQLIGFFDIGSAWTGASPFNSENTISTVVIPNDPVSRDLSNFIIELKNFRNPWLYSYGFGLRTTMLGYYVKFDLAWPVEDYEVGSPRLMATLGFDF
ncbi:MAG: translocation protein TolB [Cyclobacteriaceae bacterium]